MSGGASNGELQDRLSRISNEELERILDARDRQDRALSIGRALGAKANRQRSQDHRLLWVRQARQILADKPYLWGDLEQVAAEVREWCRIHRIALRNGREYRQTTIYRYFQARKYELRTGQ